jgi:two-component system phosphate regulon sensor histidine kinase PhoR
MSIAARKFLFGILLLLGTGALVGWLYERWVVGLLVAALLVLFWLTRQLLSFERALRTGNFDDFRVGEGIWEQLFSRFQFERSRAIRRKSAYRELLREVHKSTNAMPDAAVILDANNEIISCNKAAKTLAGLKRKKDRGQRIDNILRDPALTDLVSSSDFDRTVEIASPTSDGVWLNCRVVPYGAEQKLLLLRDVTERIRLAKMRRDFVANASHELRSPLTVINGYLDALVDDSEVPDQWERPIAQMRKQGSRMHQILDEMLELSRLESSGAAKLDGSVDVGALLQAVVDDFHRISDAAAIDVEVESDAALLGNRAEIESVVINLLTNAMRHTPADGTVTLTWRSGESGAELVVSDTGEGIDEQHIPRLTERFFRVDRGRSRAEGGIGLGLAIVKHVLMRHDAELEIISEPGQGSQFICRFPANRVVVEPTGQVDHGDSGSL